MVALVLLLLESFQHVVVALEASEALEDLEDVVVAAVVPHGGSKC